MKKLFLALMLSGMALCLAGCNIGHDVVTQYTGNEITNTLHATDYSVGSRLVTLTLNGSGQVTEAIPGTFVLEPETPIAATSAGKIEYSARLIGVGKDLRQWSIEKFHVDDDSMVRLTLPGHSENEILVNGTMILERTNRVFGNVGKPRYRVTLFDEANNVVQKWEVATYSLNHGFVSLTPVGGADGDIVIWGHYELEELKPL